MKITVTAKDIKNGKRAQGARCPVALAMRRAFGTKKIMVGTHCYIVDGIQGKLRGTATRFIGWFDSFGRRLVKPFSFIVKGVHPREKRR